MQTDNCSVLFADLVGFSRLVELRQNEVIERQTRLMREITDPLLAKFDGRKVKTLGDGFMCQFQDQISAVEFSMAFLEAVKDFCALEPERDVFVFRLGLHFGEVIILEGDVLGNTVNIASRLEGISQPGSLTISEEIFEDLSDCLKLHFKKIGRLVLKNITQGVIGYSSQPILDMDHLGFEVLGRQTQQQIKYCNSADGTTIAVGKTGEGLPFLKAPNFVTHLDYDWGSEIWQPIYEEISQLGMLVRFDQRGNGLSERNPENISFSSMVEDISAVVENEKLENFVLFGVSQGAASAIKFASDNPDIVSGLVLLGGFSRGLSRRGDGQEGKIMLETQMIRSGWENENPAFRQYFTTTMIPESSPKAKDNFDQMLRESTSGEVVAKISEVNAEIDVFDLLPKINIPTLIFHCEEDARVPLNEASILHENIKNSEFVQLESRNHIILKTDPGWSTFVTKLQDFIKKLDVKLH